MTSSAEFQGNALSRSQSDATPVVGIVDDDVSVRESLEMLIGSEGWQAESFGCATSFLSEFHPPGPRCLVLDVSLPDINGIELQQRLAAENAGMPIVMISGLDDVPMVVRAMRAGAVDFVPKPIDAETLVAAVADALERSRTALQREAGVRVLRERHASLSRRERQVMERVVAGRLNKQVAWELEISEITVKAHRGRMMQKMQARSVPDLVNMAARLCVA
jgi:FixJ family two-component response regulator